MPDRHRSDSGQPFLDVFLSHASEDRTDVASPLAKALVACGYSVWISDHEVVAGNSLPLKINEGLRSCRFGVAVLSPPYLNKHWTMKELAALASREEIEKRDIIIPVLHNTSRAQLTGELPLWAPAVSETWAGDPIATAAAIARAIGPPVPTTSQPLEAFGALARALASGELDLGPRHAALIEGAKQAVAAVGEVWSTVQASNRGMPKGASDARKRARAMMLVGRLSAPVAKLGAQTEQLEAAASGYLTTLRTVLEVTSVAPWLDKTLMVRLNEVYSGAVAATFAQFASAFTDKRVQTVTFPRRHPDLTRVLERVGDDLGRLSFAFEALVEFCLSEMPARIRQILEG